MSDDGVDGDGSSAGRQTTDAVQQDSSVDDTRDDEEAVTTMLQQALLDAMNRMVLGEREDEIIELELGEYDDGGAADASSQQKGGARRTAQTGGSKKPKTILDALASQWGGVQRRARMHENYQLNLANELRAAKADEEANDDEDDSD